MNYKYSICHPETKEIEYLDATLSAEDVKKIFSNYAWEAELVKMVDLYTDAFYNPSLEFKSTEDNHSLGLTAIKEGSNLMFSILFDKNDEAEPLEKSSFTKEDALEYLNLFLSENYEMLEGKMAE
jgi:hypothetical protein